MGTTMPATPIPPALRGPGADPSVHHVAVEASPRWVRATFAGETIADSRNVTVVYETGRLPVYYFPEDDVRMDLLEPSASGTKKMDPFKGRPTHWSVIVGERAAVDAAWTHAEPPPGCPDIRNLIALKWRAMDHWFEEDEEVFVHPRDPYHRVDILRSTRHVEISVGGVNVADSTRPTLLFETGLPTRYYLPKSDVRMELLTPTEKVTSCPYKGDASYWTLDLNGDTYPNLVWSYPRPIAEALKITDLVCFFNEKVDIRVDGKLQERPKTPWS